jgi:hypothetical protein
VFFHKLYAPSDRLQPGDLADGTIHLRSMLLLLALS